MTGVTLFASISSFRTIRSSVPILAMKKTTFWLTNQDDTSNLSKEGSGPIQRPPGLTPHAMNVPLGVMTRRYAVSGRFPTQSNIRSYR